MFVGVIVFWLGNKHFKHADVIKPTKPEDMSVGKILGLTIVPMLIAGYIGWILPGNIFGSDSTDAFILGALPVAAYYVSIMLRSDAADRKPIAALLSVFAVAIIFWAIFKQNGTALTTWAESYTSREINPAVVPAATALGVVQEVTYAKDSVPLVDAQFKVARDENDKVIKTWDYPIYFKNIPKDQLPAEGE
jgi:POT family proton-dependent oligopeptide transporter